MTDQHFPPLVLIEWLDSGQPMPSWQWLEQIEPRRPHLCVSVGFLVQDGGEAKVLAPNLGASDGGGAWDQASGRNHHPHDGGATDAAAQRECGVALLPGAPFGRRGCRLGTEAPSILILGAPSAGIRFSKP